MSLLRLLVLVALMAANGAAWAQGRDGARISTRETAPSADSVKLTAIATGFHRPLYVAHARDGSGRLFLVEQSGKIWILHHGARLPRPFLDVSEQITQIALEGIEVRTDQGLLGLTFHPDYRDNGYFYIAYTDRAWTSFITRYQVSADDPNRANPDSAFIVLEVPQPNLVHNGAHIAFGPDGYLYVALGDGGSDDDRMGAGQNRSILLGTIARIDVDGGSPYAIPPDNPFVGDPDALDEIWAYGVRHPWRFSFDRRTGDLYFGDVGVLTWEEFNFQPADSPGGENYGWAAYEGTHEFQGGPAPDHVLPFYEYDRSIGCAAIGGYVYRSWEIPELQGVYISGDWCSGRIFASWRDSELDWHTITLLRADVQINSFGEGPAGEIYIVDNGGTLFRLDRAA